MAYNHTESKLHFHTAQQRKFVLNLKIPHNEDVIFGLWFTLRSSHHCLNQITSKNILADMSVMD
jgi:hypothetical protein